jgi:hypothetical protein
LTEDSDWVEHGFGAVRMKFAYDATDGTGIYVNYHGMECVGDFNGDGVVNMDDVWPLVNRWNLADGECQVLSATRRSTTSTATGSLT